MSTVIFRSRSLKSVAWLWLHAGCIALTAAPACAQPKPEPIPEISVTASRLGSGITGASTTVITADEIERSPGYTLQDLLAQQPGLQLQNILGGTNGASTFVDMRGFGAFAVSNTLVLINGRRLNDVDMAGVDFGSIPRKSIERIEITRGNSGAVLYGDNAVGGVINIITKTNVAQPASLRVDGAFGTFKQHEGTVAANGSTGNFTGSVYANGIESDGFRQNNVLRQHTAVGDVRYTAAEGSAYVNISADDQHLGLPGARRVTLTSSELATNPLGATTPFDYGNKQGLNVTLGVTRMVMPGTEIIVDGSWRYKAQQTASLLEFQEVYLATTVGTASFTPRVINNVTMFGMPWKTIAGVDVYKSIYGSGRSVHKGDLPNHHYDIDQTSVAPYAQTTVALQPQTDLSAGARIHHNSISARDIFDPTAPASFPPPQGEPLDKREIARANHVGLEHRFTENLALFGRTARSFRFANVDERVGLAPFGTPTNFDIKTQHSRDYEGGFRFNWSRFGLQSSLYDMRLTNEIHFDPINFVNFNLDPTRRYGYENMATWQASDTVRFSAGMAYTRAVFREGPNAGNDVPLVSRWTENVGVSWNIWQKFLVLDGVVRYVGARRFDNDQANVQPLIPPHTTADLRIGGEWERFTWSFAVQNLMDVHYFDYGVASSFTFGTYNAYPLPGRTWMARGGVKF
jgi:iron complex outermembrane receptor protein